MSSDILAVASMMGAMAGGPRRVVWVYKCPKCGCPSCRVKSRSGDIVHLRCPKCGHSFSGRPT